MELGELISIGVCMNAWVCDGGMDGWMDYCYKS